MTQASSHLHQHVVDACQSMCCSDILLLMPLIEKWASFSLLLFSGQVLPRLQDGGHHLREAEQAKRRIQNQRNSTIVQQPWLQTAALRNPMYSLSFCRTINQICFDANMTIPQLLSFTKHPLVPQAIILQSKTLAAVFNIHKYASSSSSSCYVFYPQERS